MQLIRPAATIVLARDSLKGPEVLMVKRSTNSAFGDLHVFPGGTLDPEDYLSEIYQMSDDLDDQSASSMLKVERDGLAYMIAVVRECFEEVGILMSKSLPASLDPKALKNIRDQINNKKLTFYDFCLSNDIHFDFTNNFIANESSIFKIIDKLLIHLALSFFVVGFISIINPL